MPRHPTWDLSDDDLEAYGQRRHNPGFPTYAELALDDVDERMEWAWTVASAWFGEAWPDHIWEVYDRMERSIARQERYAREARR